MLSVSNLSGMTAASARDRLVLPIVLLLSLMLLAAAFVRPENNWDAIAYSALAKQFRGEEGHQAAYREIAERISPEKYAEFVSGPYRSKMETDAEYFAENMRFYASKPLYVFAVSVIGRLTGNDLQAMSLVSGLSVALAVLASFAIGRLILPPGWLLVVPAAWIVGLGFKIATLFTPDAMAICLQITFVLVWLRRPKSWGSVAFAAAIAVAWVATRANALLFLAILLALEPLAHRLEKSVLLRAAPVFCAALAAYLLIGFASGNYGQLVLFNFVFVDKPDGLGFPNHTFGLIAYIRVIVFAVFEAATTYPEFLLCLAALTWLTAEGLRRRPRQDSLDNRLLILAATMLLAMIAHIALYPAAWDRFFVGYYVTTILLLARHLTQPQISGAR